MSYKAVVYKIIIASPGDVEDERFAIREILYEWNTTNFDINKIVLLPICWETHCSPEMGDRPQAIINKQILRDADLLVGVFGTRLGTATGEYDSGTIEEIEEHMKTGKPVMLYFSSAVINSENTESEQYLRLIELKKEFESRGYIETYSDLNDFKAKFRRQLYIKINKGEYFQLNEDENGRTFSSKIHSLPVLSDEAKVLLNEAIKDPRGYIFCIKIRGRLSIGTNGVNLVTDYSAKSLATWEASLKELENYEFIEARNYKRESFKVTKAGYDFADHSNH